MLKLIKILIYLIVLCAVALIAFAYIGPLVGVDFSAPQIPVSQPLELQTE